MELIYLPIGIFVGWLLYFIFEKKIWNKFFYPASLIQTYWKIVIIFCFFFFVVFFFAISIISDKNHLYPILNIITQLSTLVFAIVVGYFAFLQLIENKFEKLKELGHEYLKSSEYKRARQFLEQAHLIKRKDCDCFSEILELYLIIENFVEFDKKIGEFEKIILEDSDRIIFFYLKISRHIFKEELREVRGKIKELIEFVKIHPRSLEIFTWNFDDIKKSDYYLKLTGESKQIFDNLISYLNRSLDGENRKKFESHNYILV